MQTIGILLLAAATAGDGYGYSKPGVGLMRLHRPHLVSYGPPPPGGPIAPGMGAGMGCSFGHPGCAGGASCPGGAGGPGGMGPGGMMGPGGPGGPQAGRRFPNTRSQVFFLSPDSMKIGWQTNAGGSERVYLPGQLTVPARFNFAQGYIYRLKLSDIPGRAGVQLYPTIEVAPSTPATDAYLTHNPIPIQFTAEDFDQVIDGGNFVTKVLYLPDPRYQELAIAGVETLVSTRLEPGVDPILEADKRGTILLIVRLGAIDLEMQNSGPMGAPGTFIQPGAAGMTLPPGTLPPGVVTTPAIESVPVDTAPVTPVPPVPAPPLPSTAPGTPPTPPVEEMPAPADAPADAPPAAGIPVPPPANPPQS